MDDLWGEIEEQLTLLSIYESDEREGGTAAQIIETQGRLIRLLVEFLRLSPAPAISFPPPRLLPPRASLAAIPTTGVLEYQG